MIPGEEDRGEGCIYGRGKDMWIVVEILIRSLIGGNRLSLDSDSFEEYLKDIQRIWFMRGGKVFRAQRYKEAKYRKGKSWREKKEREREDLDARKIRGKTQESLKERNL